MESTLEILEKVNALYSGAFTQLITITGIILAFSGILLPVIITIYQNRQLELKKKSLEMLINNNSENIESKLKDEIKKYFEAESEAFKTEINRLEEELAKSKTAASAQTLHIQGVSSIENGDYITALNSLLKATHYYAVCGDERHFQRVLNSVTDRCLPNLCNDIFKSEYDFHQVTKDMLEAVNKINKNYRYNDYINKFNRQFNELKAREPNDTNT